jgi:hypothetical protein
MQTTVKGRKSVTHEQKDSDAYRQGARNNKTPDEILPALMLNDLTLYDGLSFLVNCWDVIIHFLSILILRIHLMIPLPSMDGGIWWG